MKISSLKPRLSINWIIRRASLLSFFASFAMVIVFAAVTIFHEYRSQLEAEKRRLELILPAIVRVLATEMMVGSDRSIALMRDDLKKQFELSKLEQVSDGSGCTGENSFLNFKTSVCSEVPLESFGSSLKLVATSRPRNFDWARAIPLSLAFSIPLLLFGIFITMRIRSDLRKSIVEPIQNLARNPESWDGKDPWVAKEAVTLHEKLSNYIKERDGERDNAETLRTQASLGELAAQVAHDIRSPLAALEMLLGQLPQLPEEKRLLMRGAVGRIRDITNGLLERHRSVGKTLRSSETDTLGITEKPAEVELVSSLISGIISEKRVQYRTRLGVQVEISGNPESYGLFCRVSRQQLQRALSNLIDNSVEALGGDGRVLVDSYSDGDHVVISVKDNGRGIPEDMLEKITEKGVSIGKKEGAGLGLYATKAFVEAANGEFHIESEFGRGTTVKMRFPRAPRPRWFLSRLNIPAHKNLVVVDDDPLIHQIWNQRLRVDEQLSDVEIEHFTEAESFKNWFGQAGPSQSSEDASCLFLIDYELSQGGPTGLQLMEELGLKKDTVLVTSRFEERRVRDRALEQEVPILPKSLASLVPIDIESRDSA